MLSRFYLACLLLVLAACQNINVPAQSAPTVIPFPTMTPGRFLSGPLPTLAFLPSNGVLANPATAVAMANLPTPTPDYARCPTPGDAALPEAPISGRIVADELGRYLSSGGAAATIERQLREVWGWMGEDGIMRTDLDLTGEGTPDVLLAYESPDDGGTLLILACADGRYTARYHLADELITTPQLVQIGDMNFDNTPDILFVSPSCAEDGETCRYRTQLITWQARLGRFVSLFDDDLVSDAPPTTSDVDNDQVAEVIVRNDNPGNADTGPLRTGVTIWDWNGASYVQSVTQLDPPRFRIQVIHDADRALARLNADEAIPLYELALESPDLEPWRTDEDDVLRSYAMFKRLQAYAFTEDDRLLEAYQAILDTYPDSNTAPVYVMLATTFWNAYQVTNNLRSACLEVREIIADRPESVELLNRYGDRSPSYDAEMLCPF